MTTFTWLTATVGALIVLPCMTAKRILNRRRPAAPSATAALLLPKRADFPVSG